MNPSNHVYKPGSGPMVNGAGRPGADDGEDNISLFPLQHLPPAVRAMAQAIARTERTPETLAGCCVLGILSATIGAGLQIKSGPDRVTRGNLYLMASAESGSGKSETFRHAARPFFAYERELLEHWKAEILPSLQAEADLLESEIAESRKDAFKDQNPAWNASNSGRIAKEEEGTGGRECKTERPGLVLRRRDIGKTGGDAGA